MNKVHNLTLSVGVLLALAFTFNGCSGDDNSSSNTFAYCLLTETKTCLESSYDSSICNGQLSNNCPYSSSSNLGNNGRNSSSSGSSSNSNTISGNGDYCVVEYKNPNQKSQCMKNIEVNGIDCSIYNSGETSTSRLSNGCPIGYTCSVFTDYMKTELCDGTYIECGENVYDASKQTCYDNRIVVEKCGSNTQAYDPDLYECNPSINRNGIYLKRGIKDSRDGKEYNAVLIGEQIWMAENLNYAIAGKCCISHIGNGGTLTDENTEYCDYYGRMYNWETALEICPSGWHLPSIEEWRELLKIVGDKSGTKLKGDNWKESVYASENSYGFNAKPGGYGSYNAELDRFGFEGSYDIYYDYNYGTIGEWWAASKDNNGEICSCRMSYNLDVVSCTAPAIVFVKYFRNVRCVKDYWR
jgi:uncharacterized protein (TIGR02145 family)